MDESDYVELRCRSAFSFLEGASNPEDLAARAAELGHPALALADRGGVYGIPRVHQAARAAGVRALVGAECRVAEGPRSEPQTGEVRGRRLWHGGAVSRDRGPARGNDRSR